MEGGLNIYKLVKDPYGEVGQKGLVRYIGWIISG